MSHVIPVQIDEQGRLVLPDEAKAWFGDARKLYLCRSAGAASATLHVLDPRAENERILDELAEINQALSDEDYFAPVPDARIKR
jgi:DNA-binding transcriptional regulator/RsmH inhibitor MraZ